MTAAPSVGVASISFTASSSVRACSSTKRARCAIGRAVRVTRTSAVRTGLTITAIPLALTPVTTPSAPGQPTPAHESRPSGCAIVISGVAASPPSSRPGSANERPIHRRAGAAAERATIVRLRARLCSSASAVRGDASPTSSTAWPRKSSSNDSRAPLASAPRVMPATMRRSGSTRPSSRKRQRQASLMPWVGPSSHPPVPTVPSIEGAAARAAAVSHGASSRPCAAPIEWASPTTRSTGMPPVHESEEVPNTSAAGAAGLACAWEISPRTSPPGIS